MSQQNTPGNDPNNGRDESQSPYGAQGASDTQSNPYFGTTQAEPAPDLDAAAPQLRSAEEKLRLLGLSRTERFGRTEQQEVGRLHASDGTVLE